jgi:translocation and assembly module TamB
MAPRPDLSWQSIHLTAEVKGAFDRPDARGHLDIEGLAMGQARLRSVTADLDGNAGAMRIKAALSSLRIPGPKPDLFAGAPLTAEASINLADQLVPATVRLNHPLFDASGRIDLYDMAHGDMTLSIPALAPFAAAAGLDLTGHARVEARMAATADGGTALALEGRFGLGDGSLPAKELIGEDATLAATIVLRDEDITLERAAIDGKALHLALNGTDRAGVLDAAWTAAMSDLAVLRSGIAGTLSMKGSLQGAVDDLAVAAEATGDLSFVGRPKSPLSASLHARGLPRSPVGEMTLQSTLAGAPIDVAIAGEPGKDGLFVLAVRKARWKSAEATGGVIVDPGGRPPHGEIHLKMARLSDLEPILGQQIGGKLDGSVMLDGKAGQPFARMTATGIDLSLSGAEAGRLAMDGTFDIGAGRPSVALHATANDILAGSVTGEASLDVTGPIESPGLHTVADLRQGGRTARIGGDATLDMSHSRLNLTALQVQSCGQALRLLAPARIDFADGLSLDQLEIGFGQAMLDISGRLSPRLDVRAGLRGTAANLAVPCQGSPFTRGDLTADLRLSGSLASPAGALRLEGHGLKMRDAGTLAPADMTMIADLDDRGIRVEGAMSAGKMIDLKVSGDLPLSPDGPLNVRAVGTMDLAPFDAFLSAEDRTVGGSATLDATLSGRLAAPCINGTIDLTRGAFQDFAQGVEFHDATAKLAADCGSVRVLSMTAKAGTGGISVQGAVDLTAETVDLTVTAQNARPLASDLLTADLDADMTIRGPLSGPLGVAGHINVRRAEINIPETFASQVPVLDVRRPGGNQPPPLEDTPFLNLDLALDAPEQIFVRGHGIDAEMAGQIHITGTDVAPAISGGFDLRHGTFSLAGKTLDFVSGRVGFDGSGLAHRIDPTLAFVAQSSTASVTATLTIGGHADAPSISLSSVPALPQDEVLAQLIFGQNVRQLSPLQIAQIAQAVASLTSVGGNIDPLNAVRRRLGLDRLSAGAGSGSGDASFQAGKYVASGVYVGAQQGTSGGTRAQVQIDVTKNLKLETTIGVGGTTGTTNVTPENDPGNTVGLTYRFEY